MAYVEKWLGVERQFFLTTDNLVQANWKVAMENAIEGYHVDTVHPKTFGKMAAEHLCEHELEPNWTAYREKFEVGARDRRIHHWLGIEVDPIYRIYHCYPNLLIGKMAFFQWAFMVFPESPTSCRIVTYTFCETGPTRRLDQRLLVKILSAWGRGFFRKVMGEDTSIMTAIQRGLASPKRTSKGLISIREERLYHFQQYVQERTAELQSD